MEPSPQQHETPAKGAANEPVNSGPLSRFKSLARRLFAVNRDEFRDALKKDEAERRAKATVNQMYRDAAELDLGPARGARDPAPATFLVSRFP